MPVDDPVHEERSYLGESLLVFEAVHDFYNLPCPEHMFSAQTANDLLLILLIFVMIALDNHANKALEADSRDNRLVNEFDLEKLSGGLRRWLHGCRLLSLESSQFSLLLLEEHRISCKGESQQTSLVNWVEETVNVFGSWRVPVCFSI